jgi:hypothetical protein
MAAPLTPPRSNNNTPLRDLTADQQAQPETHSPTVPRPHTDHPLSHGPESDIESPGDSESEEDELDEGDVEEMEEMEGLEEEDLDDGQGALQESESDGDGIVIDQDQFLAVQEQMGFNTGTAGGGTVNLMREKALSQQVRSPRNIIYSKIADLPLLIVAVQEARWER